METLRETPRETHPDPRESPRETPREDPQGYTQGDTQGDTHHPTTHTNPIHHNTHSWDTHIQTTPHTPFGCQTLGKHSKMDMVRAQAPRGFFFISIY